MRPGNGLDLVNLFIRYRFPAAQQRQEKFYARMMEIPRSDKHKKVPTPHAADDMPLWDGHFLIVGKCSEGKVRNVKNILFMHPLGMAGFKIFLAELF